MRDVVAMDVRRDTVDPEGEPGSTGELPRLRRIIGFGDAIEVSTQDIIEDAPGVEAVAALCAGVIVNSAEMGRISTLFAAGAEMVFIGEAALLDSSIIDRLVSDYGGERVGIYAPLRRQTVTWSFETVSNADFKTVTPSFCEPAWEVLRADGAGTGTLASWWLKAMREIGASCFLVRADIQDDTDLNLCASLVEDLGEALWIGPLTDISPPIAEWIEHGHARQLALPEEVIASGHLSSSEG